MKVEPPASWKQQQESEPVPILKVQPVDKPASDVVYLLQTISDRLTKLEEKASLPLDPLTRHVLHDLPPVDTSGVNGESVVAKFDRDSFLHDATAPPPQQPVNRDYEVTFTNEELLAQIAQLRKDNHDLRHWSEECERQLINANSQLDERIREINSFNGKVRCLDSIVNLVADVMYERAFQES